MASKSDSRSATRVPARLTPGDRVHVTHPTYAGAEKARVAGKHADPVLRDLYAVTLRLPGDRRDSHFAMPRGWLVRLRGAR